jgi:CDP-glucose 4,6-dehydratase
VGLGERAVESLGVSRTFWAERRVLVTGVTGFKGSWLALWLRELGAIVTGYALSPPTTPSLFEVGRVRRDVDWIEADVRDLVRLKAAVRECKPEVVFHLAAQSLVRTSYESPVDTFATNVIGTVNLLEALREHSCTKAIVVVTSDKCYENREWPWPYRENDTLGGRDPYSSSKACTELVSSSYYQSFFKGNRVGLATARAGNVIGGGDWSRDRLVPDVTAALSSGQSAAVRNPTSVRPWQHVLEPLLGYIVLAERLTSDHEGFSEGWNFGPDPLAVQSVSELVTSLCMTWGNGARWHAVDHSQPHEAKALSLDASKALVRLPWVPRLRLADALDWTVRWYKAFHGGDDMREYTLRQLHAYEEAVVT